MIFFHKDKNRHEEVMPNENEFYKKF